MKLNTLFALALTVVLTACGGGLEGAYGSDKPGINGTVVTFKPNGKAVYLGSMEVAYEVDGKNVKLHMPNQQVLILTMLDDGSIQFPMVGKLNKMPS